MNLMTRGLGFGYMGPAFTSLIYAVNFIFYFLFEGTIVSHGIAHYAGIEVASPAGESPEFTSPRQLDLSGRTLSVRPVHGVLPIYFGGLKCSK
ncbi:MULTISPECIES: hypothetical protein [Pseudomonas fluorescens group]|uniref:hypothetical protein n=1 Tax=Pseudomonas fluorescens group TaxID=136843 RepID=UPI001F150204|nr:MULTISPECIES: hypothetical protein [Pseudomonas fluorescens group]